MSVVHGANGCRHESAGRSWCILLLYYGHLVRREHVEDVFTCGSNHVLRAGDGADDGADDGAVDGADDGQDVRRTWVERMSA